MCVYAIFSSSNRGHYHINNTIIYIYVDRSIEYKRLYLTPYPYPQWLDNSMVISTYLFSYFNIEILYFSLVLKEMLDLLNKKWFFWIRLLNSYRQIEVY